MSTWMLSVRVEDAESIDELVAEIEQSGAAGVDASITVEVEREDD